MEILSSATVSQLSFRATNHIRKLVGPTKLFSVSFFTPSQRAYRSFAVQAIDPQKPDEQKDSTSNLPAFTSQQDLDYLWKLLIGSVIGGAVIKYGSAIFPDSTRPNLTLALLIISSPVLVSVLLLINQSSKEKKPK